MTTQVVYNEKMFNEGVLKRQVGGVHATTGIVIGRKEKSPSGAIKYHIYDVIVTPLPDKIGAAL